MKKTRRVARGLLIAAIVTVMCTATVAAAKLGVPTVSRAISVT